MGGKQLTVGILALQGDFKEHKLHIEKLSADAVEVRLPQDLQSIDCLIIPGGESTAIGKLATDYDLIEPLQEFAKTKPVWGTCAGLIFIASEVGRKQSILNLMDITVERNAFGRQADSFIEDLTIAEISQPEKKFPGVFIRAPIITGVGRDVAVLATLKNKKIVAARQGNILATCFHPELTDDLRLHQFFFDFC